VRKVSTRRALIPAAALVLTASFAATASAGDPTMSAEEAAVEDKLDALPEASDDSSAPPRCGNPTKYATSADRCSKVKLGSGTAKLPTKSTGWRFWTTSS
jgi:hypothetical protein